MTSQSSTKEALSLVDKLKQCILKQDQVIRAKISENVALKDKIVALEKEREQLKHQIKELKGVDLASVDCAVVDLNDGQSRFVLHLCMCGILWFLERSFKSNQNQQDSRFIIPLESRASKLENKFIHKIKLCFLSIKLDT